MPKVEIKLDLSALDGVRRHAADAALETMGALRTEVVNAQVMPFDTGNTQNNQTVVDQFVDGEEIHTTLITDAPQARRLYHHPEYNFQTVNNPNAQGEWLAPWLPGGDLEGFVPETFEARLKERLSK